MFKKKRVNVVMSISFVLLIFLSANFYAQQQEPERQQQQQQQHQHQHEEHMVPEYDDAEVAKFAEVMQAMHDAGFTEQEFVEMLNVYFQDPELQERVNALLD